MVRRHTDGAVDVHCHGGMAAVARIEESLVAAGCSRVAWRRWAEARSDEVAAAALVALANARTERTAAILLDQYDGALRRAMIEIRQSLDGGDQSGAQRQVDTLLGRAGLGQHLVEPWRLVLAGPVNAGKSSLINAVAGYDRAIVHATPGTTRDAVTLVTAVDGWPVELCDTAGLRRPANPLEHAGIELAASRLAAADLAILVFDRSLPWSEANQRLAQHWPRAILVHNKCDLPAAAGNRPAGLVLSALRGEGVNKLLEAVSNRLVPDPPPLGAAVPFTPEQIEAIRRACNPTCWQKGTYH